MFRSLTLAAVACVLAMVLTSTPASAAAGKGKSKAPRAHSLVGTLEKVDGQTLTVKTSTGAQSVMLESSTHITQSGKAIQAAQLSGDTGSRVKVRYTEANGQKQAQMVTVSPAPKVAKK
jgi:hypothetical protein